MDLKNRVVLITGASRGIGAATAKLAAKEGAKVVVNYNISLQEAKSVAEEIKNAGGEAIVLKADITNRKQVEKMVDEVINKWGRIDVLINNAGIYVGGQLDSMLPNEVDNEININLRGLIHTTQVILRHLRKQKDGVIVNISSALGKRGRGGASVYSATKFGVIGFTQALGDEARRYNVRVYAVCPWLTATDIGGGAGMPPKKVGKQIIDTVKENLGLSPGGDTEIYH